jgi:hypothetical protein
MNKLVATLIAAVVAAASTVPANAGVIIHQKTAKGGLIGPEVKSKGFAVGPEIKNKGSVIDPNDRTGKKR